MLRCEAGTCTDLPLLPEILIRPLQPSRHVHDEQQPVEGVGAENRFLHLRLGVSLRQDASEEAVRSTSS